MLPGPTYYYKCPQCENLISNRSIASGNTFGATIYSDGKLYAPMLPEYPIVTKCWNCDTIFWLVKTEPESICDWDDVRPSGYEAAVLAEFLDMEDNFRVLNEGLAEGRKQEIYIRQRILWMYNDRLRSNEPMCTDNEDEKQWEENLRKLADLLDPTNVNELILLAELNRNLGDFDTCISLAERIVSKEAQGVKKVLLEECGKKNRWVVQV